MWWRKKQWREKNQKIEFFRRKQNEREKLFESFFNRDVQEKDLKISNNREKKNVEKSEKKNHETIKKKLLRFLNEFYNIL